MAACETILSAAIAVRVLGMFLRLLIVMLFNDERALMQQRLDEQQLRMKEEKIQASLKLSRYVFHELRR